MVPFDPPTSPSSRAVSAVPPRASWYRTKVVSLSLYSLLSGMLYATLAAKGSINNKSYGESSDAERAWAGFNFLNSLALNFLGAYFFAEGVGTQGMSLLKASAAKRIEFSLAALITIIAGFAEVGLSIDAYSAWGEVPFVLLTTLAVINMAFCNVFSNKESITSMHHYIRHLALLAISSKYRQINQHVFKPLNQVQNRHRVCVQVSKGASLQEKCKAIFKPFSDELSEKNIDLGSRGYGAGLANFFYSLAEIILFIVPLPVLMLVLSGGQQGLEELFDFEGHQKFLEGLTWSSAISNALLYMYCTSLLLDIIFELGARTLAKLTVSSTQIAKVFGVAVVLLVLAMFSGASMAGFASYLQEPNKEAGADNSYFSIAQNTINWLGDHVWSGFKPFFYSSVALPILMRITTAAVNAYTAYGLMLGYWAPTARQPDGQVELFPVDVMRELYTEVHESGVEKMHSMLFPESASVGEHTPLLGDQVDSVAGRDSVLPNHQIKGFPFWRPAESEQASVSWPRTFFAACLEPAPDSCVAYAKTCFQA